VDLLTRKLSIFRVYADQNSGYIKPNTVVEKKTGYKLKATDILNLWLAKLRLTKARLTYY
jgi:hypothetical protein